MIRGLIVTVVLALLNGCGTEDKSVSRPGQAAPPPADLTAAEREYVAAVSLVPSYANIQAVALLNLGRGTCDALKAATKDVIIQSGVAAGIPAADVRRQEEAAVKHLCPDQSMSADGWG